MKSLKRKAFNQFAALFLSSLFVIQLMPITSFADVIGAKQDDNIGGVLSTSVDEINTPSIVCEIEEKRTEFSKTFKMNDGTYCLMESSNPIHNKVSGKFVDDISSSQYENKSLDEVTEMIDGVSQRKLRAAYQSTQNTIINDDSRNSFTTYSFQSGEDEEIYYPSSNLEANDNSLVVVVPNNALSYSGKERGIISANIKLGCNYQYNDPNTMYVYEVNSPLINCTSIDGSEENEGEDNYFYHYFSDKEIDYQDIDGPGYYYFDITNLYSHWEMGIKDNNGVMFQCKNGKTVSFFSEYLILNYIEIEPLDNNYKYYEMNNGRAGDLYINELTFSPSLLVDIISCDCEIMPVDIKFLYNKNLMSSQYGCNWDINFNSSLTYLGSNFIWDTFDGNSIIFTKTNPVEHHDNDLTLEKWTTEDENYVLWIDTTASFLQGGNFSNNYIYSESDGYTYKFNSGRSFSANVNSIEDNYGNQIIISYTSGGLLSYISDGYGRKYVFNYEMSDINSICLSSIVVNNNDTPVVINDDVMKVEFHYVNNNDVLLLSEIEFPDGESVYYYYDDFGRLSSYMNIDGKQIDLDYIELYENGQETKSDGITSCRKSTSSNQVVEQIMFSCSKTYEREITFGSNVVNSRFDYNLKCVSRTTNGKTENYSYNIGSDTYIIPSIPEESNVVLNPSFETKKSTKASDKNKAKYWTFSPDDTTIIYRANYDAESTRYLIKVNGNPSSERIISQSISKSAIQAKYGNFSSEDIWVLKADGYIGTAYPTKDRLFGVEVFGNYANGLNVKIAYLAFDNTLLESWQNGMIAFKIPTEISNNEISALTVQCVYRNQQNTVYFDNIELAIVEQSSQDNIASCPCGERCSYSGVCPCECIVNSNEICDCVSCNAKSYHNVSNDNGNILEDIETDGTKVLSKSYEYDSTGCYISSVTDENSNVYNYQYDEDSGFLKSISDDNGTTEYSYNAYGLLEEIKRISEIFDDEENIELVSQFSYTGDKISSVTHNGFTYDIQYDENGNYTGFSVDDIPYIEYEYINLDASKIGRIDYGNGLSISYSYNNDGNIDAVYFSRDNSETELAYQYSYDGNVVCEIIDYQNGYTTLYNYETVESGENVIYDIYCYRTPNINDIVFCKTFNEGVTEERFHSQSFVESDTVNKYDGFSGVTITSNVLETSAGTFTSACATDYFGRNISVNNMPITDDLESTKTLDSCSAIIQENNSGDIIAKSETYNYYNDSEITAGTEIVGYSNKVSNPSLNWYSQNEYSYIYDGCGNITHIYYGVDEDTRILANKYTYDKANQLIREDNFNRANPSSSKTIVYEYDSGGNITTKTLYSYTVGDLGNPIDTISYSYQNSNKDLLSSYDNKNIVYDALGNPLEYNGNSYTWSGRQLTSFKTIDNQFNYTYDSNGNCVSKTSYSLRNGEANISTANKTEYIWDDGKLIYQYSAGDMLTIKYLYDQSGNPYGLITNGSNTFSGNHVLYYVRNAQGDVEKIVSAQNGMTFVSYEYDAWGNMNLSINTSSLSAIMGALVLASNNVITYRSYVYDQNLKMYWLGSRFYNPEWGRFISLDSMKSHLSDTISIWMPNLLCYCQNNPLNYTDHSGYATRKNIFIVYNSTGNGFTSQAKWMQRYAYNNKDCQTFYVLYKSDFKSAWNNLKSYSIKDLHLYLHGKVGALSFCDYTMEIDEIQTLNKISLAGKIYLYSCNGGTSNKYGESVAGAICKRASGVKVRAVVNGSVYYRDWYQLVSRKPLTKNKGAYWADFHYGKYKGKYTVYCDSIGRNWKL